MPNSPTSLRKTVALLCLMATPAPQVDADASGREGNGVAPIPGQSHLANAQQRPVEGGRSREAPDGKPAVIQVPLTVWRPWDDRVRSVLKEGNFWGVQGAVGAVDGPALMPMMEPFYSAVDGENVLGDPAGWRRGVEVLFRVQDGLRDLSVVKEVRLGEAGESTGLETVASAIGSFFVGEHYLARRNFGAFSTLLHESMMLARLEAQQNGHVSLDFLSELSYSLIQLQGDADYIGGTRWHMLNSSSLIAQHFTMLRGLVNQGVPAHEALEPGLFNLSLGHLAASPATSTPAELERWLNEFTTSLEGVLSVGVRFDRQHLTKEEGFVSLAHETNVGLAPLLVRAIRFAQHSPTELRELRAGLERYQDAVGADALLDGVRALINYDVAITGDLLVALSDAHERFGVKDPLTFVFRQDYRRANGRSRRIASTLSTQLIRATLASLDNPHATEVLYMVTSGKEGARLRLAECIGEVLQKGITVVISEGSRGSRAVPDLAHVRCLSQGNATIGSVVLLVGSGREAQLWEQMEREPDDLGVLHHLRQDAQILVVVDEDGKRSDGGEAFAVGRSFARLAGRAVQIAFVRATSATREGFKIAPKLSEGRLGVALMELRQAEPPPKPEPAERVQRMSEVLPSVRFVESDIDTVLPAK